jgi:hypothetical protein
VEVNLCDGSIKVVVWNRVFRFLIDHAKEMRAIVCFFADGSGRFNAMTANAVKGFLHHTPSIEVSSTHFTHCSRLLCDTFQKGRSALCRCRDQGFDAGTSASQSTRAREATCCGEAALSLMVRSSVENRRGPLTWPPYAGMPLSTSWSCRRSVQNTMPSFGWTVT